MPIIRTFGAFAEIKAQLRTGLNKELHATLLSAPSKMSHERHLYIIDGTAIVFGHPGCGIDDRLVVEVENVFFPSGLGIIHFSLQGTDGVEIFFAHIAEGDTTCHPTIHLLVDFRGKAHIAHGVTAVYANAHDIAVFTNLGCGMHCDQRQCSQCHPPAYCRNHHCYNIIRWAQKLINDIE